MSEDNERAGESPGDRGGAENLGPDVRGVGRPAPDAGDPEHLDPAEAMRAITMQQQLTRGAVGPDSRILFGVWGVAWLVGYLALWFSTREHGSPEVWAAWTLAVAIFVAMAVTIVYSILSARGVRGPSARTGAMYGWTWFLGFGAYGFIMGGLVDAGASDEVMALAANGFACVIVGLMYVVGAQIFCDANMYPIGAWMLVTAAVASSVGLPQTYLVMALAGGGGFLVMVAVEQVLRVRRRAPRLERETAAASGDGRHG